jgi:membrane-associated phospholipid phosphatase
MITRSWKISIHMVGIGGLLGAVLALTTYHYPMDALILLCSIILIAGGLASARLWLGAHTKGQVYAGFAVGFCSVFLNIVLGIWI